MKLIITIIVGCVAYLLLTIVFASNNDILHVEIFTDSIHPVSSITQDKVQVKYYLLDAPQEILISMNVQIEPLSLQQAEVNAKLLLKTNNTRLQTAYHGLVLAKKYQLTQFPAVVFNRGEGIVYGATNINQAITAYWLMKKRTK